MTKTTPNRPPTTLSSLVSTLRRFLESLESRNEAWLRNKQFAYGEYRNLRKAKEWHHPDADNLATAIAYNEAMLVVTELVTDLIHALERNPFPGEQKRVVAVAVELLPDAAVRFDPGKRRKYLRREGLWRTIFEIGDVSFAEKIYFPECGGEWDIVEIEGRLMLLVREDNTILAAEVPPALGLSAKGKVYAAVKETLKGRGWVWRNRREGGVLVKIVTPPTASETAKQPDIFEGGHFGEGDPHSFD